MADPRESTPGWYATLSGKFHVWVQYENVSLLAALSGLTAVTIF
jgi:hypothetical protein